MAEDKTVEEKITNDMKPFQPINHPVFKDTLLELQKEIHKFNEVKMTMIRIWRFIFTNEKYDSGYIFGKRIQLR